MKVNQQVLGQAILLSITFLVHSTFSCELDQTQNEIFSGAKFMLSTAESSYYLTSKFLHLFSLKDMRNVFFRKDRPSIVY